MKISVIMAVLNSVDTVEQAILSVLSQSHQDFEYIVIDGGSTDGTLEVIDRYRDRIHKVISEADQGIYDGMNKGIGLASGDVVGFLNADDVYESDHILERINSIFGDQSIQGCYADLVYVDNQNLEKVIRYWQSQDYQDGLFEKGWMPAHPTFYVRRSVYEQFGIFDMDYKLHADMEITARLIAKHKIKTRYIPEIWVRMRVGGATNSGIGNVVRGNLESYKACRKLGLKLTPFYFIHKFLIRIPQFFKKPQS